MIFFFSFLFISLFFSLSLCPRALKISSSDIYAECHLAREGGLMSEVEQTRALTQPRRTICRDQSHALCPFTPRDFDACCERDMYIKSPLLLLSRTRRFTAHYIAEFRHAATVCLWCVNCRMIHYKKREISI